jgi:hypothetical protein
LSAADRALDAAIQIGPRPESERFEVEYGKSRILKAMSAGKVFGTGVTMMLDDAAVTFFDVVSTYAFYSEDEGYNVPSPGRYRVTLDAYPYQADSPVILTLYSGVKQGIVASLDNLIGSFDLIEPEGRAVEVTTYLEPGMLIAPSLADADTRGENTGAYYDPTKFVTSYTGEGIAMKSLVIEGPLNDVWPPKSTRELLTGITFDESGQIELSKPAMDHINEIVETFAQRAFRRPLAAGEAKSYADLALPLLEGGRPFLEALRVPLRTVLNARHFSTKTVPAALWMITAWPRACRIFCGGVCPTMRFSPSPKLVACPSLQSWHVRWSACSMIRKVSASSRTSWGRLIDSMRLTQPRLIFRCIPNLTTS